MKQNNQRSGFFALAAVVFLILGIVLRLSYLTQLQRTPDERVINSYASKLHQYGVSDGFSNIVENYRRSPGDWIYPSPSRVGYYLLVYATQKLVGDTTIETAAYVAITSSILAMLLGAFLARYLYGDFAFFLVSLLVSTSSLSLSSSRRNWNESFIELSMVVLVTAAFVMIKRGSVRLWTAVPFLVMGSLAISVKESAFLNVGLAGFIPFVFFLLQRRWEAVIKTSVLVFLTCAGGVGSVVFFMGGFDNLRMIFQNYTMALPTNQYAVLFQDGPASDFLRLFYILSPGLCYFVLCGVGCSLIAFVYRRIMVNGAAINSETAIPVDGSGISSQMSVLKVEERFLRFSYFIQGAVILLFLIASSIPKYFKNLRYASPLYDLLPVFAVVPIVLLLSSEGMKGTRRLVIQSSLVLFTAYCAYLNYAVWREVMVENLNCVDWNIRLLVQCGALSS